MLVITLSDINFYLNFIFLIFIKIRMCINIFYIIISNNNDSAVMCIKKLSDVIITWNFNLSKLLLNDLLLCIWHVVFILKSENQQKLHYSRAICTWLLREIQPRVHDFVFGNVERYYSMKYVHNVVFEDVGGLFYEIRLYYRTWLSKYCFTKIWPA